MGLDHLHPAQAAVVTGRLILGCILLAAAVAKGARFSRFAAGLAGYRLPIPEGLLRWTAGAVISAEAGVALLLLGPVPNRDAGAAAGALFVGFSLALGRSLVRGLRHDCLCLGSGATADVLTFARSLALAAGAVGIAATGGDEAPAALLRAGVTPAEGASLALVLGGATTAFVLWGKVGAIFRLDAHGR
jgi:hypothetical protein